ncbi:MAG: cation-transporting P-type ATPase, partial [Acidimicrobiales bacterium]
MSSSLAPAQLTLDEAAALSAAEVLARLHSDATGLSSEAVAASLASVGPNVLSTRKVHASMVLVRQLRNPLLLLLLGAALLSGVT